MKKLLLLLSLLSLITTGCSDNNESIETIEDNCSIEIRDYQNVVYENRELLSNWAYAKQDVIEEGTRAAEIEEAQYFMELKSKILPSAQQFVTDLNITKDEIELMTGEQISNSEEYENALVGLMLFVTTTNSAIEEDVDQTRGGSFKDCFIEATGIGAGVALIAGLSKGTVSKAIVKATLKLVVKAGTRTLNGIGLALLAAEITWCMW